MKQRIAVIFGGPSVEHDVSILSAKNVLASCLDAGFDVVPIYVDKDMSWRIADVRDIERATGEPLRLLPGEGIVDSEGAFVDIDVAFPLIHGTFGEDGTLQAVLEALGIPYIGSGVLASSLCMDKPMAKRIASLEDVPVAKFMTATTDEVPKFTDIVADLGSTLFVKPASLGSSVGVSRVTDQEGYEMAVAEILELGQEVLIEECISGREIECSFLDDSGIQVSRCGEISTTHEFYSYKAKYLDEESLKLTIPAAIPSEVEQRIQDYVRILVKVLGLTGYARIDFFLTDSGEVIFNEVNTIPGFTQFSMYPMLWEERGYSGAELVKALISSAVRN